MKNLLMAVTMLAATIFTFTGAAVADTTEMWNQQHDGGGNYIDSGTLVTQAPDGNLVVAGESTEVGGGAGGDRGDGTLQESDAGARGTRAEDSGTRPNPMLP